jgi:hypothetical protein
MASALLSFFALTFTIQDVTLPNGVRVISSPGPAAVAVSPDRSVVVVVGEPGAEYAAWPSPSPAPSLAPPLRESWRIESGAAELVMEWAAPPGDETLLLTALLGPMRRKDGILRFTGMGWPPEARRRFDAELERLASLTPKDLGAVKEACTSWATPRNSAERAQRLLQVTLATGNPRLYRELSDRCGRLTVGAIQQAARALYRRPRRILVKTPVEAGPLDP